MLKFNRRGRTSLMATAVLAALAGATVAASAATPFQNDVTTAINRGLDWLAASGAFNNPPSGGSNYGIADTAALPMLALLEKRASGIPSDPPSGYSGASAADKVRLENVARYIINQTNANGAGFYAYRDGARLMALASYALTGGPDQAVLGTTITIKAAMDRLTDRTLASQNGAGYFCYNNGGCNDSSTTQLSAAGLYAAKAFYTAPYGGGIYADAARAAAVTTALNNARQAYVNNAGTGSDNASCRIVSASERGHGYHPPNEGYPPSLQQTAAGIYIQLFGGADVNTPNVQAYMEWVRNHYRYSDLDNLRNSWPEAWDYYMWSSFKGMELIRQMGVVPAGANLGPDAYGLTGPDALCNVRQAHLAPASVVRVPSFGAGGAGYYSAETPSQYFDYAYTILGYQCTSPVGYFGCNSSPGTWSSYARQAYLLLVLQRSTGIVVERCDITGPTPGVSDGQIDSRDIAAIRAAIGTVVGLNDPRDYNLDGKITVNDVRACTLKCTKPKCAP